MTFIQKKIEEKYHNSVELIALLTEFQLEEILNKAILQIETKFQAENVSELPKLSGIILNEINSNLSKLSDPEKKKKLEYLLSDIFQGYLDQILERENSIEVLSEIQSNMVTACEYGGYDFKKLSSYFNIEKHQILLPKSSTKQIYYSWNGKLEELDELSKDLFNMKIILSVKEFKKLFKPISGSISVHCNKEKVDMLIILFQVLKERSLITPKGKGNSGHFAPFVQHSVDKDGFFLIQNSANKEHEKLKRNKARYQELKEKIENLVRRNVSKSMRQ